MATVPSQPGQMNTKSSETGSTGTTEGMMGTNHHMSDMKVDQQAFSPMANMMKKMIKRCYQILVKLKRPQLDLESLA